MITDSYKNVSKKHVLGVVIKANNERFLFDSIEEGLQEN